MSDAMGNRRKSLNDIIIEEWKDVKGYEGAYVVSNLGNIFSVTRKINSRFCERRIPGAAKKKTVMRNGYEVVGLWKNNKSKLTYVHRIVGEAFIPNPNNKKFINHIDGNKRNNTVNNLEWCSCQENTEHAFRNNLNPTNKPVRCIETGEEFRSLIKAGEKYGSQVLIGKCANGKIKTAYGLHWEFIRREKQ